MRCCRRPYSRELQLSNFAVTKAIFLCDSKKTPKLILCDPQLKDKFLQSTEFKTTEKLGTLKCARSRCKTCPFVQNADKISGPKGSVKITDRFMCTSANVIYCITCTLCKKTIHWRNRKTTRRPIPRIPMRR